MSDEAQEKEPENGAPAQEQKKNKKVMIISISAIIGLLIAGIVFFLFKKDKPVQKTPQQIEDERAQDIAKELKQIHYVKVPDLLINLQNNDGTLTYMRLQLVIQVTGDKNQKIVKKLLPQIVNQFQVYLRGLQIADVKGSAGMERISNALLERANQVVSPINVKSVLIQGFLIQ